MKTSGLFLNYQNSFSIVATFFALWLSVYFDSVTEDYFGYILIITIGILHGANDIRLIDHMNKKKPKRIKPIIPYIIIVLFAGLGFYLIPSIALLTFVLLSCYHFGEQHWTKRLESATLLEKSFYLFYGIIIFSLLFFLNAEESITIIQNIAGIELTKPFFGLILLISVVISCLLGIFFHLKDQVKSNWLEEIFLLCVFGLVFYIASLIWAFAIYFILWHSIPSLTDQVKLLYGKTDKDSIKSYIRSSWLYYVMAVVGLGITLYLLRNQEKLFLSVFFSFLAAITLPHVLVMMGVYNDQE